VGRPISFGAIGGFGFIGFVLGTFGGWITGLVLRVTGAELLASMSAGATAGAVLGAVIGVMLCRRMAAATIP
jgi:hypothetical protein